MVDVLDSTRVRRPPAPETDYSSYLHLPQASHSSIGKGQTESAIDDGPSGENKEEAAKESKAVAVAEEESEQDASRETMCKSQEGFSFCCERSWASHSFLLPPGDYILLACVEELLESDRNLLNGFPVSPPSQLPPKAPDELARDLFKENIVTGRGVWAQVTSIGSFSVTPLTAAEVDANLELTTGSHLTVMKSAGLPLNESWPFMVDHQHETGSRGLMDLITRVRAEVDKLNVELLELKYGN
jgi:hypothetical protein